MVFIMIIDDFCLIGWKIRLFELGLYFARFIARKSEQEDAADQEIGDGL